MPGSLSGLRQTVNPQSSCISQASSLSFPTFFFSHGLPEMGNEIESASLYLQNLEHDLVDGKAFFGSGPVPSRYLQRQTAAVTFSSPTAVR